MSTSDLLLAILNRRKHDLDMPITAISRRSRVHPSTVQRLLAGELPSAGFAVVCQVAAALGVTIAMREESITQMKRQAANAAAAKIMRSVQATSALEAQAVDPKTLRLIAEQIATRLLAGPGSRLWAQ